MRYIKFIALLFTTAGFFACEEVVEIDVNQSPPQLVVDGLLTDEDTFHTVRISTTANFNGESGQVITGAAVQVRDNLGNIFNYIHNPTGADSLNGMYYSEQKFAGVTGRVYDLEVLINELTLTATDTLLPITEIDSLVIREDPFADPNDKNGRFYQVLLYAAEPQETRDFYYFRFYRDSVIVADNSVFAFDDEPLGDRLDGLPSPVNFAEGEYASVEIYSLSREQFVFYSDLGNLLNSDGGMFSPPPANPRSNIRGGALGLFQVSGLRRAGLLIEPQ
jgi:hypothetical protein